ncbi:class I SAM-dependent methyltransferase [Chlorogloea sp. CCALA 695]|uniref:class I SAM-dependent methyltransferase n=1 Tax=Chlorogloea sp. CCALA 695 TaxID=2107693 RepID=UPI000D04B830|nr:class I SAM-dependent methyltransferase [Chlorogloea sp. CCALA 695]PSB32754.1 class I SAM-dependent methyltransferase [Chlorogloea sp. CCALA 695]
MVVVSPLTGSKDITLVKTIESSQLINDWQRDFHIDITAELQGYRQVYLYQCNQTYLKFFSPPNIAGSGKLYEQLQKFDWFYMPEKWEHKIALRNFLKCKHILEIGCAFGSFVQAGLDAGFDVTGIELNAAAVKIAQQKKLPVKYMSLQDFADLYPESADAVCSFQVLEHTPNPRNFIKLSLKILKKNGILILCVPNSESFLKYQYTLLDMPPHHMTQWSEASLRALENIFPIRLEKVIREPLAKYHVSGYVTSYSNKLQSVSPWAKLLFNRYTLNPYKLLLNAGIRKFLTGQSLYVQFRKIR